MMDLILPLFNGSTGILVAVGALVTAVLGAFVKGRLDGAKLERAKQADERNKARDVADEVDNDVGAMTPEQRREALRKWAR